MKIVTSYKLQVSSYNLTVLWSYALTVFFAFSFLPSTLFAQTKADTIHVTHYNINLEIRDFVKGEIKGYTELEIEAKKAPLQKVYLHFYTLQVDSVKKGNTKIWYSHKSPQLEISLPFTTIEEKQTIRVYYHGKAAANLGWGGFFFDTLKNVAYNMGVGMSTFPHSIGRVWYPCIDEFTDKSTYTFNITTDADKKAICGGKLTDSIPVGDGIRWTWKLENRIPTYLASVAVGEYKAYKDTILSISGEVLPIEIYANPATIAKVSGTFVNLKKFIQTYEKRWGPCRWQRVGYVGVPFSNGAMEHATNIALPSSYINGNTNNQDIIAHELAHSWFGNLLTCEKSTDMWINEGFARYGEYLCYETLDPTLQKYQTEIKKLHFNVLKNDKGEYALDNLPTSETYNSTIVYDKGGLVAHTLRNYMGDELHFSSIKQLLEENKYSNLNSVQFFKELSRISGIKELNDFYLGWVHQKGFLNFNIDSIKRKLGNNNMYEVAFKQKLYKNAEYFANNNRVEVEFFSASGSSVLKTLQFSGESAKVDVELPFDPVFWAIDPNNKMSDACFDYTQTITKTGVFSFVSNAKFSVKVNEYSDTSILRVEYNPVPPTAPKTVKPNIYKISEKHFWRIGFMKYNEMQAQFSFTYNTKAEDAELLQGCSYSDLVLLYREDASYNWKTMPATVTSPNTSGVGTIEVDFILPGEYTLGVGEYVGLNEWENNIRIYPNPTTGQLIIDNGQLTINSVEIFDIYGKKQKGERRKEKGESEIVIDISYLSSGIYFVKIQTEKGTKMQKVIKN